MLLEEVQRITDNLKAGCYQLSLTAHIFVYTTLQLWPLFTSIQATSESWAFGTGMAANTLTPTRLCSWRAGRCLHSISGRTENDRQSREFSCNPKQASQILGVYWSTQHTCFWQNMLIVVWHESYLNHLQGLRSSKRQALHPCSSKIYCLIWSVYSGNWLHNVFFSSFDYSENVDTASEIIIYTIYLQVDQCIKLPGKAESSRKEVTWQFDKWISVKTTSTILSSSLPM